MKRLLTALAGMAALVSFGGADIDGNPVTGDTYIGYIDGGTTKVSEVLGLLNITNDVKSLIDSETGGTNDLVHVERAKELINSETGGTNDLVHTAGAKALIDSETGGTNGIIRSVNGKTTSDGTHAVTLTAKDVHGVSEVMLAPVFELTNAYAVGQVVLKDQTVYRAKYSKSASSRYWDEDNWEEVTTIGDIERSELTDTFVPYGTGGGFTSGTGHKINTGAQTGSWAQHGYGYTILTPTGIKFLYPHEGSLSAPYSAELYYNILKLKNSDGSETTYELSKVLNRDSIVDIENCHTENYSATVTSPYHIYQYLQKYYQTKAITDYQFSYFVSNEVFQAERTAELARNKAAIVTATNLAYNAAKSMKQTALWLNTAYDNDTFYLTANGDLYGYYQNYSLYYTFTYDGTTQYLTPDSESGDCKRWTCTLDGSTYVMTYEGDDSFDGGTFKLTMDGQSLPGSITAYRFLKHFNLTPLGKVSLVEYSYNNGYRKLISFARTDRLEDYEEVYEWEKTLWASNSYVASQVLSVSAYVAEPTNRMMAYFKSHVTNLWNSKTGSTIRVPWSQYRMCTAVNVNGSADASVWASFMLPDSGRTLDLLNASPWYSFGSVVKTVNGQSADAQGNLTGDFTNYSAITGAVNTVKELHYDPGLSVTWSNVYDNGHVYMITVTNTNVSVAQ